MRKERFMKHMDAVVPNVRLVKKSDSLLMRMAAILMFFNRGFMSQYFTTLGRTIYIPDGHWDSNDWGTIAVLGHECRHIYDARKWSVLYYLGYIFPQCLALFSGLALFAVWFSNWWLMSLLCLVFLGPWPAPWRVYFERRGYVVNAIVPYWRTGKLEPPDMKYMYPHFTGSDYYFMSWTSVERSLRHDVAMAMLTDVNPKNADPVLSAIHDFVVAER